MKLFRLVLVLIVLLLGLPFVIGSFMSSEWDVESSVVIPSQRLMVHYVVEDPSRWPQWNALCPPAETMRLSGKKRGEGAILTSGGDADLRWEITESDPAKGVTITRSLGGKVQGTAELTYQEVEDGTEVTWRDHGDVGGNPMTRLFAGVVRTRLQENCDRSMTALKALVAIVEEEEKERKKAENAEPSEAEEG